MKHGPLSGPSVQQYTNVPVYQTMISKTPRYVAFSHSKLTRHRRKLSSTRKDLGLLDLAPSDPKASGTAAHNSGRVRASLSPDIGPWDGISLGPGADGGLVSVNIEYDPGSFVRVTSVKHEVLGGDGCAGAGDFELDAAGVELCAAGVIFAIGNISLVQANDLLADQVLPRLKGGRQLDVRSTLGGDQLVDGPLVTVEPVLGDLGPACISAVGLGIGRDIGDYGPLMRRGNDIVARSIMIPKWHFVLRFMS